MNILMPQILRIFTANKVVKRINNQPFTFPCVVCRLLAIVFQSTWFNNDKLVVIDGENLTFRILCDITT